MKDFNLDDIRKLVEQSLKEDPTGDDWLDSRYNEQVWHVGHTQPYYRLFYLIARELEPALSVELGSWQATAAAHLAVGNPDGLVLTIDIHREDKDAQKRTIEAVERLPNLTYINKWTWDAVADVRAPGKAIDLLFIDAWHDYKLVMREWAAYEPLLADVALVIADDITTAYNFEGMLRFWDELPGEKFLNSYVHPGVPMGFLKYERKPNDPGVAESGRAGERGRPAAGRKPGKAAGRSPRKRAA